MLLSSSFLFPPSLIEPTVHPARVCATTQGVCTSNESLSSDRLGYGFLREQGGPVQAVATSARHTPLKGLFHFRGSRPSWDQLQSGSKVVPLKSYSSMSHAGRQLDDIE
jgi:hypothetical protein